MSRETTVVPRAEPRSYYGQPVIKPPVWTWEIPVYFWVGGVTGASAGLAWASELAGNPVLARRAWTASLAGLMASPPLLVSDLGRPERFLNMLRMFKVTSPMSVGSWVLSGFGAALAPAAARAALPPAVWERVPAQARAAVAATEPLAKPAAALLGLPLATYTAALVANTSVPVWHEARRELPFVFGAGAAASAGAIATLTTPPSHAGPARRLALIGATAELIAVQAMERRLGELAEPYHEGTAGRLSRAAHAATAAGALSLLGGRRSRPLTLAGAGLLAAGAFLERWSVYKAGFASARDPRYTVGPQRERLARRG